MLKNEAIQQRGWGGGRYTAKQGLIILTPYYQFNNNIQDVAFRNKRQTSCITAMAPFNIYITKSVHKDHMNIGIHDTFFFRAKSAMLRT